MKKFLNLTLFISFIISIMAPLTGVPVHKMASTLFLLLSIIHTITFRKKLGTKRWLLLAIDYSVNEQLLYEKFLTALEKLRQDFINEGIIGLYESKLEETLLGKSLYDNGLASRFLYIVSL